MEIVYFTVNFLIFLVGLVLLLKRPVSKYLLERKKTFIDNSVQAKIIYDEAFSKLTHIRGRLIAIAIDGNKYIEDITAQAKIESNNIVNSANSYAKNIILNAKEMIQEETIRARNEQINKFISSVISDTHGSVKNEPGTKDYGGSYIKDYFMESAKTGRDK